MKTKLVMVIGGLMIFTATAQAKGKWAKEHPRRHEVNQRLENQKDRVNAGVAKGQLSQQQAAQIHQEDHAIRTQERQMAAQNGGHITKTEQKALNQEENQVSRQIHQERQGK